MNINIHITVDSRLLKQLDLISEKLTAIKENDSIDTKELSNSLDAFSKSVKAILSTLRGEI